MVNTKVYKFRVLLVLWAIVACSSCHSSYFLSSEKASQVQINPALAEDSSIVKMVAPYKASLDSQMNTVLNTADFALEKKQPESLLGNFFADAILNHCRAMGIQADLAFPSTMGGMRSNVPKGNISNRTLFELMPFENELVLLELSGAQVHALAEWIVAKGGQPISGWNIVSDSAGVKIYINDKAWELQKNYKVLTSDYLANGGDQVTPLMQPISRVSLNIKLRDALMAYVKAEQAANRTIHPTLDGRIKINQ